MVASLVTGQLGEARDMVKESTLLLRLLGAGRANWSVLWGDGFRLWPWSCPHAIGLQSGRNDLLVRLASKGAIRPPSVEQEVRIGILCRPLAASQGAEREAYHRLLSSGLRDE